MWQFINSDSILENWKITNYKYGGYADNLKIKINQYLRELNR
jgi:hypothetical protein